MRKRVLVSCPQMQARLNHYQAEFVSRGIDVDAPLVDQQMNENDLLAVIERYDGMIAGDDVLTARVLERAERLKVISKWGVGVDNIDLEAAKRHDIKVLNTPGVFDDEVADVCLGYMVMLARGLHLVDAAVRRGHWLKIEGTSLAGKTLGIVGLGGIGLALARRATVIGMRVVGHDRAESARSMASEAGVEISEMPHLLSISDIISLNCTLTPENRHMLGTEAFGKMKPGMLLVNTARGGLIDEVALVDALRDGTLAGAALDVFETEPLPKDHPIFELPNCILGAHNASNSREAVDRTSAQAMANLLSVLEQPADA